MMKFSVVNLWQSTSAWLYSRSELITLLWGHLFCRTRRPMTFLCTSLLATVWLGRCADIRRFPSSNPGMNIELDQGWWMCQFDKIPSIHHGLVFVTGYGATYLPPCCDGYGVWLLTPPPLLTLLDIPFSISPQIHLEHLFTVCIGLLRALRVKKI